VRGACVDGYRLMLCREKAVRDARLKRRAGVTLTPAEEQQLSRQVNVDCVCADGISLCLIRRMVCHVLTCDGL